MRERLALWGGGAQLLRGLLAFAFPLLLAFVPQDIHYTAPLVVVGVFGFIAARWLVLAEPATLRDMGGMAPVHMGEAVFATVALAVAFTVLHEVLDVDGSMTVIMVLTVLAYLFLHGILLPLIAAILLDRQGQREVTQSERPILRKFIRGAAFIAGEVVVLITIGLALEGHEEARQGPWGLWDVVPGTPLLLLLIGYLPIVWLEMAATKSRTGNRAEVHGAIEASLVQAGAVVVCAFTGIEPWL
jgi:hypothetical protein